MRTLELLVSVTGYESRVSSDNNDYYLLTFEPLAMRVAETSKWCAVSNEVHKGQVRVPRALRVSSVINDTWFKTTNTTFNNILILTVEEQVYGVTKYMKNNVECVHGVSSIESKKASINDIRFDVQKCRQNHYDHAKISDVCDIPFQLLDKGMTTAMKPTTSNLFV